MRKIVETLLEEGIDESTIHKVLDLIEEEYEVIDELQAPNKDNVIFVFARKADKARRAQDGYIQALQDEKDNVSNPNKETRRVTHKNAERQEAEAMVSNHEVNKTGNLINSWAKRHKQPVEVVGLDNGSGTANKSELKVDGETMVKFNNPNIPTDLQVHKAVMDKKKAAYYKGRK